MTADFLDAGEAYFQGVNKIAQGGLLHRCPRVASLVLRHQPADIADANRVFVVVLGMRTLDIYRSARVYRAVQVDEIMIADILPPIMLHVVTANGFDRRRFAGYRSRAMNDDFIQFPHIRLVFPYSSLQPSTPSARA